MDESLFEVDGHRVANLPWLKDVQSFIARALPGAKSIRGPVAIHALYDQGPDRRATLRFAIDEPLSRDVVVKVNLFPLLSGSGSAHRLVSRCSPDRVPCVIAVEETADRTMLLLEAFTGSTYHNDIGRSGVMSLAKTLAKIQLECTQDSGGESGLETISPSEIPNLFEQCLANIQTHFEAWHSDEGKLQAAMGFPAVEVLDRLETYRPAVASWVEALEEPGIDLTIDHGDCHFGNACWITEDSVLIYDWENASRSHPFFSAEKLLASAWGSDTGNSGGPWGYVRGTPTQDELKSAYLVEFGGNKALGRAFDAAMCLAVVKEMHHEMEWARLCSWKHLNPEWTAQLINRLVQHSALFR